MRGDGVGAYADTTFLETFLEVMSHHSPMLINKASHIWVFQTQSFVPKGDMRLSMILTPPRPLPCVVLFCK